MSGRFNGVSEVTLNQFRIVIPSQMKEKFSPESLGRVVLTVGVGRSVVLYPLDNWDEYCNRMEAGTNEQVAIIDYLADYAKEQKIEASGRVKIDQNLLDYAGITDKAVLKGNGNYISLWSPDEHKKKIEQGLQRFANLTPKDLRG